MKNPRLIRPVLALASTAFLANVLAPIASAGIADPVAIVKVSVPANNTILSATPFARPVERSGTVSSHSASSTNTALTVTLDGGETLPDLSKSFSAPNEDNSYVVEVSDGPALGLILDVVGGASNSVTVRGTIPNSINLSSGSKFNLRKAHTLTSLFGSATNTTHPFGRGTTATAAAVKANVQFYDIPSGSLVTYFVSSSSGGNWRAVGSSANVNHAPLGLGHGFAIINRQTSTPFEYTLSGDYRVARTRLICPAGKKLLVGNPGPLDVTLWDSTIPDTTPTKHTGTPTTANPGDNYGFWKPTARTFENFAIGGTSNTNNTTVVSTNTTTGVVTTNTVPSGAAAYLAGGGSTRRNPTIAKFTSILVTPVNTSAANVITIAPALVAP